MVNAGGGGRDIADAPLLLDADRVMSKFIVLSRKICRDEEFEAILTALLPEPKRPRNTDRNPGLLKAWEANVEQVRKARAKIRELRHSGLRMDLNGSRGTLWGALNAILEFVDHHQPVTGARVAYSLLGDGMDFMSRAFKLIVNITRSIQYNRISASGGAAISRNAKPSV